MALDDSPGVQEPEVPSSSPSISFGDLLSPENQTPPNPSISSIPPIPSSPSPVSSPPPVSPQPSQTDQSQPVTPSISFGDLIKDIKPEESVIQPPAPVPSEPTITSIPTPPPITINSPPIPSAPPSPASPSSDQSFLRRQKANQVRSQKKTNHLSKIMELAKHTPSISNTDIQRLLHVSQSTATNYLAELSRRGLLKRLGIRGGAKYTL